MLWGRLPFLPCLDVCPCEIQEPKDPEEDPMLFHQEGQAEEEAGKRAT
jgi:hypothetical protein